MTQRPNGWERARPTRYGTELVVNEGELDKLIKRSGKSIKGALKPKSAVKTRGE